MIMDVWPTGGQRRQLHRWRSANASRGQYVSPFGLCLFAFTTMIGWSFYGERCAVFCWAPASSCRSASPGLSRSHAPWVELTWWLIADTLNAFMAIPNLIALIRSAHWYSASPREHLTGGKPCVRSR